MSQIVTWLFGIGLTLNAGLFIPQAISIWRKRNAAGVSVLTFGGFNAMQLIGLLHGYFQGDRSLIVGMGASLITCGTVTCLALVDRYVWHRAG